MPLPLSVAAALGEQNQVVNCSADVRDGLHGEDSRHRLSRGNSLERVPGQSRNVVGNDNPTLAGSPFENRPIIRAGEPDILHSDYIERRQASQQTTHDVAVEIFVGCKPQHRPSLLTGLTTAGEKSFA